MPFRIFRGGARRQAGAPKCVRAKRDDRTFSRLLRTLQKPLSRTPLRELAQILALEKQTEEPLAGQIHRFWSGLKNQIVHMDGSADICRCVSSPGRDHPAVSDVPFFVGHVRKLEGTAGRHPLLRDIASQSCLAVHGDINWNAERLMDPLIITWINPSRIVLQGNQPTAEGAGVRLRSMIPAAVLSTRGHRVETVAMADLAAWDRNPQAYRGDVYIFGKTVVDVGLRWHTAFARPEAK